MNPLATKHLAVSRLAAIRKAPYFSSVLLSLVPREAAGLGTVGVTENLILMYDPEMVLTWDVEQFSNALLHEVHHVVRNHALRANELMKKYHYTWNIACDAAINQDLLSVGLTLPLDPITPENQDLEPGKTAEEYFEILVKRKEEEEQKQPKDRGGEGESKDKGKGEGSQPPPGGSSPRGGNSSDGEPQPKSKVGGGRCGSCAGHAVENEPSKDDPEGRTATERTLIARQAAKAIQDHAAAHGRGSLPAGLQVWAKEFLTTPKIQWQTKLARCIRATIGSKSGVTDYKYDRPSRRQAGIGYGEGHPILPRMYSPIPQVAVAVDTSGSMGTEELTRAVAETAGILKAVGSPITFYACDAEVHSAKKVHRAQDIAALMVGGGGTDFGPLVERVAKQRPRPDILIVVTDGCGPAPQERPRGLGGAKVIWVLVGSNKRKPYFHGGTEITWGEFIEVDETTDDVQKAA